MNFITFILLLLFSVTGRLSASFSGSTDARIRKCLLNTLKSFHLQHPQTVLILPRIESSLDSLRVIPFDLKLQSMMPFLEPRSLLKLTLMNRGLRDISLRAITDRLLKLSPVLCTPDSFVNSLILSLLEAHFPLSIDCLSSNVLNSPFFQDELELLTLKFNFDHPASLGSMPRNILYYLLCFLHEIHYGLDSPVPTTKSHARIHFIRQVRQNNLPLSLEYFSRNGKPFDSAWLRNVNYFSSTMPTASDIISRFGTDDPIFVIYGDGSHLDIEFKVAILELLVDFISDLPGILKFLAQHDAVYSRILFEKISPEYVTSNKVYDFRILKGIDCDAPYSRIYNVDSLNHFNNEDLKIFEQDPQNRCKLIKRLGLVIRIKSLSLANLDMFSQIINSEIAMDQRGIRKTMFEVFLNSSTLLLGLIAKESIRPLSIGYEPDYIEDRAPFTTKSGMVISIEFFKVFDDMHKDPFFFLFLDEDLLFALKPFIQDKFNLDHKFLFYRSDSFYRSFNSSPFCEIMKRLKSQEFTFKRVLNELGRDDLKKIFSSDLTVFSQERIFFPFPIQYQDDEIRAVFPHIF
jgi:hypothetical protein